MARLMHYEMAEGNAFYARGGRMCKEVLQKIRQFLISIWRSIRKESPVVIDGKPLHESDPRAKRILRRLHESRKRVVPKKAKVS
jgi:hypothetical protein